MKLQQMIVYLSLLSSSFLCMGMEKDLTLTKLYTGNQFSPEQALAIKFDELIWSLGATCITSDWATVHENCLFPEIAEEHQGTSKVLQNIAEKNELEQKKADMIKALIERRLSKNKEAALIISQTNAVLQKEDKKPEIEYFVPSFRKKNHQEKSNVPRKYIKDSSRNKGISSGTTKNQKIKWNLTNNGIARSQK